MEADDVPIAGSLRAWSARGSCGRQVSLADTVLLHLPVAAAHAGSLTFPRGLPTTLEAPSNPALLFFWPSTTASSPS